MVMLGIDPGFYITGYALLVQEKGKISLLSYNYLKLPSSKSLPERVLIFNDFFDKIIKDFNVSDLSLETPFLGKSAQNFLKLGYLRGILYLLAQKNALNIYEFSPSEVKLNVTGKGGASKEEVQYMVLSLFPGIRKLEKLDATDALAVCLCGVWQKSNRIYNNNIKQNKRSVAI